MDFRKAAQTVYKQILTPGFFLFYILMPLITFLLFLLIVFWLFPPGINKVFAARTIRYLTPAIILAGLIFLALSTSRKNEFHWLGRKGNLDHRDIVLLLFPLTPIIQYVLNNPLLLSWQDGLVVVGLFALIACVPILLVPLLFRRTAAFESVQALGLAFAFLIMDMASLSGQFAWHESGSLKILWPLLTLLWSVLWIAFQSTHKRLVYLFVTIFFILNTGMQVFNRAETVFSSHGGQNAEAKNPLFQAVTAKTPRRTPNIYLLVYDSYPAAEALAAYGLDNQAQEEFLKETGFILYPQVYSVAAHTLSSISFMLNSAPEYYGSEQRAGAGKGIVQKILKNYGYTTYGIFASDYFFRDNNVPSYDYWFPQSTTPMWLILTSSILDGEFRFDVNFEKVSYEQFLQEKAAVFSAVSSKPRFVYAHSKLPGHSQNSGACLPNEVDLFAERLTTANTEIRRDVKLIIDKDPTAIIIVAGDHGPYLTKNCTATVKGGYRASEINRLDIQDRFSVLLAIRWPSSGFETYDKIIILQDVFPAVFAYLFEDPTFLQARFEPVTLEKGPVSDVSVENGIIHGGIDDGEPLFIGENSK